MPVKTTNQTKNNIGEETNMTTVAPEKKKVIPKKTVPAAGAPVAAPRVAPAPKLVAPAPKAAPAPVAKAVAPVAKTAPAPKAVTPAAAPKAAPKVTAPAAAPVAAPKSNAPKVGSAKKAAPAKAPKAPAKKGGKIQVGRRKETAGSNFEVNVGGRTTRDAFIHIAFNRLREAGLEMESKKLLGDVIGVIEEVLIEITSQSSFKFMNAMFRLRPNKARVYSVPTTASHTLVPAHNKVLYTRYADDIEILQGNFDSETSVFYPEGEDEGILLQDVSISNNSAPATEGEDQTDEGVEAEDQVEEGQEVDETEEGQDAEQE